MYVFVCVCTCVGLMEKRAIFKLNKSKLSWYCECVASAYHVSPSSSAINQLPDIAGHQPNHASLDLARITEHYFEGFGLDETRLVTNVSGAWILFRIAASAARASAQSSIRSDTASSTSVAKEVHCWKMSIVYRQHLINNILGECVANVHHEGGRKKLAHVCVCVRVCE